jgi:hypothetical protein
MGIEAVGPAQALDTERARRGKTVEFQAARCEETMDFEAAG